jgi:hypothetical protein
MSRKKRAVFRPYVSHRSQGGSFKSPHIAKAFSLDRRSSTFIKVSPVTAVFLR